MSRDLRQQYINQIQSDLTDVDNILLTLPINNIAIEEDGYRLQETIRGYLRNANNYTLEELEIARDESRTRLTRFLDSFRQSIRGENEPRPPPSSILETSEPSLGENEFLDEDEMNNRELNEINTALDELIRNEDQMTRRELNRQYAILSFRAGNINFRLPESYALFRQGYIRDVTMTRQMYEHLNGMVTDETWSAILDSQRNWGNPEFIRSPTKEELNTIIREIETQLSLEPPRYQERSPPPYSPPPNVLFPFIPEEPRRRRRRRKTESPEERSGGRKLRRRGG